MQVAIPNAFAAGDRVLVQLFDNANNNCADAAHAVAYDATPTVAVREKPLASGRLKVNTSAGPDGTTSGAAADVKPEIGATLVSSSTACDAVGVKDAVAITFKNASAGTATDAWVVDITDVKIAVGASVPRPHSRGADRSQRSARLDPAVVDPQHCHVCRECQRLRWCLEAHQALDEPADRPACRTHAGDAQQDCCRRNVPDNRGCDAE